MDKTKKSNKFELEERTLLFAKRILNLCNTVEKNFVNRRILDQLLRSGTSVGANYREANETDTKKDFKNRVRIAKKEAKESLYWLDLLIENNKELESRLKPLYNECQQLLRILVTIYRKA